MIHQPVTRLAPAKLNLSLHVIGRRDDGYHLLDSLVAFTELGDTIEAADAAELSLVIDGPFGGTLSAAGDENLVLRSARLLADRLDRPAHARLRLTKRLPVASGIGGGSSDAAATLLALAELWNARLDHEELAGLGLRLGADVPVCLAQVPARLQGIGEHVSPLPGLPETPVLLVNPNRGLSTPTVFKARHGTFAPAFNSALLKKPLAGVGDLVRLLRSLGNGLTDAAISLMPEIRRILDVLEAAPGSLLARMSGSGATCFALFEDDAAAARAAQEISVSNPNWWVAPTRLAK